MTTATATVSRKLDKFFFFPKKQVILPIIAQGIQEGAEKLRWFGTFESHIFEAMDYIVTRYHEGIDGEINLGYLHSAIKEVAEVYEMVQFIKSLRPDNFGEKAIDAKAESEENLIGVGVLNADYADADSDCYETAGGYRSWVATKGTIVRYYLNADLTIRLVFDSNCVVDHYNNNFFGVSTGGGTTEYKLGERVEKRSVTLGREAFDKGWKKAKIDAKVRKVDLAKLKRLATEFVPEFAFIFA